MLKVLRGWPVRLSKPLLSSKFAVAFLVPPTFHTDHTHKNTGSTLLNMLLRPILIRFLEGEGDSRVSREQCADLALPPTVAASSGDELDLYTVDYPRPTVLAAEIAIAEEVEDRTTRHEDGGEASEMALGIEEFFPGAKALPTPYSFDQPFNATVFGSYHNPQGGSSLGSLTTYPKLLSAMVSAFLTNVPSELPRLM